MLKKLVIIFGLLLVFNIPLQAQQAHIELNYQSFRPFIHFQININNYDRHYDSYKSTYLTGYMDGVNDAYFDGILYVDRPINIKAYRAGFRDGYRDRRSLIRLRGHRWYRQHRFAYDDYYAPRYAVQIWLERLSLAFLQAPAHRLPSRWKHRAHPRIKKYRKWMTKRSQHKRYDKYYSSSNVERRFHKRIRDYRQRMDKVKKSNRSNISDNRSRINRKHFRSDDKIRTRIKSRGNRSDNRQRRSIERRTRDQEEKVRRSRSRGSNNRENVKKKRSQSRSNEKTKRSKSRKRDGSRNN